MNWVDYALHNVIFILQMSIKNPKSLAKERTILITIRDYINEILTGIDSPAS